jgi:hypothetical protein
MSRRNKCIGSRGREMSGSVRLIVAVALATIACFVWCVPSSHAQTTTTGAVVGTVTDPAHAVISSAEVEVVNQATNESYRTKTNAAGQYTALNLAPGAYRIVVRSPGFREARVEPVIVGVAKSSLANIELQVGASSETVQVVAGAVTELQTLDSSVGDVVGGEELVRLPTNQRNAVELAFLQPATLPALAVGGQYYGRGGNVAGTRGDQNTITLDGIDTTERFTALDYSNMTLPVDAVEEFRGTTANPNANVGATSSGGYFTFATRHGGNQFHGAAYGYLQNSALNANTWDLNFLGQKKPELKDERFGGRFGGPLIKDKTFFFGFYEGRRFPQSTSTERTVPSDTMRQGILRFRDAAGAVVSYDLANSTLCGPTNSTPCDPRGLGMSPLVAQYWTHYPQGNDPSAGDGLNTIGFKLPVPTPSKSDKALLRLDHNFNQRWHVFSSLVYQRHRQDFTGQVQFDPKIVGPNRMVALDGFPQEPRNLVVALNGQISPNILNETRFGFNKQDYRIQAQFPTVIVPGSGVPLDIGGSAIDDPGDVEASSARPQLVKERNWSFIDNLSILHGRHTIQVGFTSERREFLNARPDRTAVNVIPLAVIRAGNFVNVPASERPPTCSGTQADCIAPSDTATWNRFYGTLLGIWDNTQSLVIRDAQGHPTKDQFVVNDDFAWHHEFHAMDTWRVGKSFTLSMGLNFRLETPWADNKGREYFVVDSGTNKPIDPKGYLHQKEVAAEQGKTFDPQIAFVPASSLGRKMYSTIYEPEPRIAAAWNPSFEHGVLGRLLGDRKTVLRGGYSLTSDRISATPPVFEISFNEFTASSTSILAPTCDAAGTPGVGCIPGVSPFRVGVDGAAFAPSVNNVIPNPFIPPARNTNIPGSTFGLNVSGAWDPNFKIGLVRGGNFTVQRDLPHDTILEVGWIGRWGTRLPGAMNLNAVPVNMRDMSGVSKQTFAQAFDAVATQLRKGVVPSAVTPQPWFENVFGAGSTATIAGTDSTSFINGTLSPLFSNVIDPMLQARNLPTVLNQQFSQMFYETDGGWSNYNALFTSVRKRVAKGLSFTVNWTWAHSLDTATQSFDANAGPWTNPYHPGFDYGDSLTDVRHTLQIYGTYDLPVLRKNRLFTGWYISGVGIARTGLPLLVSQGGDEFGSPSLFGPGGDSAPLVQSTSLSEGVHHNVTGSGGVGTSGDPAAGGTGLNLFANPDAVFKAFRPFLLSQDTRGSRGAVRGLGLWNVDTSLGKSTNLTEAVKLIFTADFFNLFNHPTFDDPGFGGGLSLNSPANFGVISTQASSLLAGVDFAGPRRIQIGLRVEF